MYFDMDSTNPQHEIQMLSLGTIFILRKDKGVEGWFRKWQFSLNTLRIENVLTRKVAGSKPKPKHPYVI